ncbi:MAG: SDR family NAD(P)-dependent oxidoreductase [Armatimonadaceae bacterium]
MFQECEQLAHTPFCFDESENTDTVNTKPLSGHIAVISGASTGIGQAYALRLSADGADIAIADIQSAEETVRAVEANGQKAFFQKCDVTSEAEIATFADAVRANLGTPDILINNAGIYPFNPLDQISFDEWRTVMALDLDSPFLMCKAFVGGMREKGWGRIVNVSSTTCWMMVPNLSHYIAAKMGVIGLTRALASELGEHGITVNCIAPGLTRTATTEVVSKPFFEVLPAQQAIHRVAETEDMSGVVAFLVSDDARFVTGQTIAVDGGMIRL